MFEGLFQAFWLMFNPTIMIGVILGTLFGIVIGAVPGIGAGIGMTLLLPVLFWWPPEVGLPILTALWAADGYGGSISSILLDIPGGPGAAITSLDGYPMAMQGRSLEAMGIALGASAFAGIVGAVFFVFFSPQIAKFVLRFNAPDYFIMTILGLTVVATSSEGKFLKGFIGAGLGLILGSVGMDLMTGFPRFSFGIPYLYSKLDIQVLILGLFALG